MMHGTSRRSLMSTRSPSTIEGMIWKQPAAGRQNKTLPESSFVIRPSQIRAHSSTFQAFLPLRERRASHCSNSGECQRNRTYLPNLRQGNGSAARERVCSLIHDEGRFQRRANSSASMIMTCCIGSGCGWLGIVKCFTAPSEQTLENRT
jgi:hypothetical protein